MVRHQHVVAVAMRCYMVHGTRVGVVTTTHNVSQNKSFQCAYCVGTVWNEILVRAMQSTTCPIVPVGVQREPRIIQQNVIPNSPRGQIAEFRFFCSSPINQMNNFGWNFGTRKLHVPMDNRRKVMTAPTAMPNMSGEKMKSKTNRNPARLLVSGNSFPAAHNSAQTMRTPNALQLKWKRVFRAN